VNRRSSGRQTVDPEREARFERRMRRIAIAVLAAGLAAATLIFVLSAADVPVDEATASIQDSRQYQMTMERIGGKAAVFAAQFSDWFAGLWHGRRLAGTVALLSLAVSGLCYAVSRPPR
jgi:hypothetical protein